MTVSSIQNYGLDAYQMQQLLNQGNRSTAADSTTTDSASPSAMQTLQAVVELTRAAMDNMGVGENGRVSFGQINAYREQLEKDYAAQLKQDFELMGVDPNISFQLKENDQGGLTVSSNSPDKDKVQQYFDDHPELVEKYKEIQILANLDAARRQLDINPAELKKRLQIENMSAWWSTQDNASNIMDVSDAGTSWFSGIDTLV